MSWKLVEKMRGLARDEEGLVVKDPGGTTAVALVYPNTYYVGMSNLAVHSLYRMLNDRPDIRCERAFLPDPVDMSEHRRTSTPVLTVESQRPISEFDVIAFTVSFENDLTNVIPILEMSRIPHRADERGDDHPLIIAGGVAITLNPQPLAEIADMCITGEFEAHEELHDMIVHRRALTPDTPPAKYRRGSVRSAAPAHIPIVQNLDDFSTETVVWTPHTEFGAMHLIEVMRGCPQGCAFCATPGIYGKPRMRSYEAIAKMIEHGSEHRKIFGLIGAEIASHPRFADIARFILDRGATFSLSSIRVDRITPDIAQLLKRSGTRSISLGIEAARDGLRASIGKTFTNERVMESLATLARHGITNVRFYFMIGLPGETDADVDAIPTFADDALRTIRKHAPRMQRTSSVELTITPFVPKPLSGFEGESFAGIVRINDIHKRLRQHMGRRKDISISLDSAQQAAVEAYLAKAGPEAIAFLEEADRSSPRKALKVVEQA